MGCRGLRVIRLTLRPGSSSVPHCSYFPPCLASYFYRQMSPELSHSTEGSQKDEEASRLSTPILPLGKFGRPGPLGAQGRPAVRKAKLALAHTFPRTYRAVSKGLLYLRGPRPKRDLERASCPVLSCDINRLPI